MGLTNEDEKIKSELLDSDDELDDLDYGKFEWQESRRELEILEEISLMSDKEYAIYLKLEGLEEDDEDDNYEEYEVPYKVERQED